MVYYHHLVCSYFGHVLEEFEVLRVYVFVVADTKGFHMMTPLFK